MSLETFNQFAISRSCAYAALCWGGAIWGASLIAVRLLRTERLHVRLAATGLLTLAFVVLAGEFLGTLGLLRPELAAILTVVFAAAAYQFERTSRPGLTLPASSDDAFPARNSNSAIGSTASSEPALQTLLHWLKDRSCEGYWLVAPLAAIGITVALIRGLRYPPISWDSMTYHYFLPARWVQLGGIVPFAAPGGMDTYRASPPNLELLVAWVILPFRSDLLVNLVNFPVFLLAAIAAYGIMRELRVPPRVAFVAPIIITFSPPIWGLVTTQYADPYSTATLLAGVFFLIRFLRSHQPIELYISAAGFGLAAGARYNALPLCLAVISAVVVVLAFRRIPAGRIARIAVTATAVAILCGGYQYVRNWIELQNPVYPMEVKIAGIQIFEPSLASTEALSTMKPPTRWDDLRHFRRAMSLTYRAWGPTYGVILALAIISLRRGQRLNPAGVTLALFAAFGLFIFYWPTTGHAAHVRVAWEGSSQRFLALPFACALCLACAELPRIGWPLRWIALAPLFALIVFRIPNYQTPNLSVRSYLIIAAGAVVLALIVRFDQLRNILTPRRRYLAFTSILLAAITLPWAMTQLTKIRHEIRSASLTQGTDYHTFPRDCVPIWIELDAPPQSHTIAITRKRRGDAVSSYVSLCTSWFLGPLLGSRLQNRVCYASIYEPSDIPSPPFRAGLSEDWSERVWLENLQRLGVDRLVVQVGAEPECHWIAKRPELFRTILESNAHTLYALEARKLTSAIADAAAKDSKQFSSGIGASARAGEDH